jgi:hypothetical protein
MSLPRLTATLATIGIPIAFAIVGVSPGRGADEPAAAGAKSAGKFVATGQALNTPKTIPTLSGDGAVVTHLLEGLEVQVGVKSGSPEADTRCLSVRSILDKHDYPVYIRQTIRGHVDLQPGVDAVVLLQSCGKSTLIPLPDSGSGDFKTEVVGAVQSGPDYLGTIFVLLQRSTRDQRAGQVKGLLSVDNLELAVTDAPGSSK